MLAIVSMHPFCTSYKATLHARCMFGLKLTQLSVMDYATKRVTIGSKIFLPDQIKFNEPVLKPGIPE